MKRSESIAAIAAALAKAQGAMASAKKDMTNPHFKSKYADLASIVDAIKKPLADNGIAYVQTTVPSDRAEVRVETTLLHASGEWLQSDGLAVPVQKADAQGFGSALTYCRRYDLAAICGVAPDDDDGNAATNARTTAVQQEQDEKKGEPPFTEEEVAEWLGSLDKARDMRDLAKRTAKALAAADGIGDRAARDRFRAHNIKISKMLEQAATA